MIPGFNDDDGEEEKTLAEESAFKEGVDARNEGYFHDMNPFVKGSHKHKLWMAGWADQGTIEITE